uniref:C2H2-type domain-containing protein n=1 Tax=Sparus aurata TaxID=8175 RepID=A0A671UVD9_SPAAU
VDKQQAINRKDDTPSGPTKKQVIIKVEKLPLSCSHGESSVQKDGHTNKHTWSFSNQKDESICQMREPMRVQSGRRSFRCSMCLKKFRFNRALKTHMTKMHKDQVKTSQTNAILSWTLPSGKTEEKQEVLISPWSGRPYTCPYCTKCFTYPSHQRRHLLRHTGVRLHPCQFCDKSFLTPSELTVHTRTHTGERPFGCAQCGKRFARSGNLRAHQRDVHMGKRPFACTECGKRFAHRGNLRVFEKLWFCTLIYKFMTKLIKYFFSMQGNLRIKHL